MLSSVLLALVQLALMPEHHLTFWLDLPELLALTFQPRLLVCPLTSHDQLTVEDALNLSRQF